MFYRIFQNKQNMKIITKNWEWWENIIIGIVFKRE